MTPTVSIIMATYNRAHFIVETLNSIQNQTFLNWECLIIDDGGTDNTIEVVTHILNKDSRFRFFKRPNNYKKGLPGCRNYGLDLAQGNYIIFFDDDDIVHHDNLKICFEVLNNQKIDFCHYQKLSFGEQNPVIEDCKIKEKESLDKNRIEEVITQNIGLASCTVMWKSKCFDEIRFDENLLYAEEWECYSRIISENFEGLMIDLVLYYNRKHPESNTGEFYRNDTLRRASKAEAILLVLQNLKEKQLLSQFILRYFITLSSDFKEFNLFSKIIHLLEIKKSAKWKWHFFYLSVPLRMPFYKLKKSLAKKL